MRGHVKKVFYDMAAREHDMTGREHQVKAFEDKLARLGIIWDSGNMDWHHRYDVENEIELLNRNIDFKTVDRMRYVAKSLGALVEEIELNRRKLAGKEGDGKQS